MSPKFLFAVAVVFALAAIAIWAVFLRPVPTSTASGTITKKTFKPAGTYWQYPVGANRGFQAPTAIPIAEADVFEIAVDGFPGPVFFPLNTIASKAFDVGQKVQIQYQERGVPFIWKRVYVVNMNSEGR